MKKKILILPILICVGLPSFADYNSQMRNFQQQRNQYYARQQAYQNKIMQNRQYQFMEAGGTVEIVGPLDEIGGNMFFKDYGKMVDSYIVLGGSDTENSAWWFGNDKITIETSGMEDEIIDWNHGDTIKITGKISYSCGNLVYMFQDDDNHITVEKLS